MNLHSPDLCRVRAVTAFISLTPDAAGWQSALADAKRQCDRLAAAFAAARNLPFIPAKIRMSLHTRRPNNLLMMDCALPLHQEDCGLIENSRRLAAKLPQL